MLDLGGNCFLKKTGKKTARIVICMSAFEVPAVMGCLSQRPDASDLNKWYLSSSRTTKISLKCLTL